MVKKLALLWQLVYLLKRLFKFVGVVVVVVLQTLSVEISEYSSDSENLEEYQVASETTNLNCHQNLQFRSGTGIEMTTRKSASDWLKSAQTLLQTPKKKADKSLRTPEDSAKKRKLLRLVLSFSK